MIRLLLFLFSTLIFPQLIFAQYKLRISDLNSRIDYQLKNGQKIYYQLKNTSTVYEANYTGVMPQSILLDSKPISVDSIIWISLKKYHDNNFRIWARNTVPNLHLAKAPSYDLETSYLAEIVPDTTTLAIDSDAFAVPSNKQLLKVYFPQLVYNLKQQALSPFRASPSQWKFTAGSLITCLVLIEFDKAIQSRVQEPLKTKASFINLNKNISLIGSEIGIGFVGGWLAGGLLFKNNKATETALLASQSVITSTIWNRLLKYSTLRERPYSATFSKTEKYYFKGPKQFAKLVGNSDYHSFASGHTATAFAIATVFAEQYKEVPMVVITAYTLASAVGVSRVITNKHWSSDVIIGALIGYGCAKQITSFKKSIYRKKASKFGINTTLANVFINNNQYPVISITAFVK